MTIGQCLCLQFECLDSAIGLLGPQADACIHAGAASVHATCCVLQHSITKYSRSDLLYLVQRWQLTCVSVT